MILALYDRSVCLHMISTLRPEQIEQIDPRSLNRQKHFNSLSVKRTVNVCCHVATGKFPHCTTVNDCTRTDTQTQIGEHWRAAVIVNDSQYKRVLTGGEKNTLIAIQPQTRFST